MKVSADKFHEVELGEGEKEREVEGRGKRGNEWENIERATLTQTSITFQVLLLHNISHWKKLETCYPGHGFLYFR